MAEEVVRTILVANIGSIENYQHRMAPAIQEGVRFRYPDVGWRMFGQWYDRLWLDGTLRTANAAHIRDMD